MELKELSEIRARAVYFPRLFPCRLWICCCQTRLMKSNAPLIAVLFGLYVKSAVNLAPSSVCLNSPRLSG